MRVDPAPCPCGNRWTRLAGGILGRTDDMIAIRGNNFYPGALENVLRRFAEVVEYRASIHRNAALAEMSIEIEASTVSSDLPDRIVAAIRDQLMFRAAVSLVAPGTLPRFEMKAQRIRIV